ncbi:MAG: hypothetical protein LQ339_003289 [Xanthoria mediterranea]|nr:MAG: hypothetical protein LQ339_003289 [Xanthoria mediterranea]
MDPEDDSVAACNKYNPDVVSQSLLATVLQGLYDPCSVVHKLASRRELHLAD